MKHIVPFLAMATFAFSGANVRAQTTPNLIEDHVLVTAPYYGSGSPRPEGYEASYGLQLGSGTWPFPYVHVHLDDAVGKPGYAQLVIWPSYLTYIQDVQVFQVTPGAEISFQTLAQGDFTPLFKAQNLGGYTTGEMITSAGTDPDIYLGFTFNGNNASEAFRRYGWVHLQYTQQLGLTVIDSAMTLDGSGIHALGNTPIPAVDEASIQALAMVGLVGAFAVRARRKMRA